MQHDVASCTARCGVVIANRDSSCCDITLSPCLALLYARHYDLGFRRHIVAQLLRLPRVWHFRFASLLQVDPSLRNEPRRRAPHAAASGGRRSAAQRAGLPAPGSMQCTFYVRRLAGLAMLVHKLGMFAQPCRRHGHQQGTMSFHACSTSPSKAAHADRICQVAPDTGRISHSKNAITCENIHTVLLT